MLIISGLLAKVLSWKFFLPLSRISYCLYLIHIGIVMLPTVMIRAPLYFTDLILVRNIFDKIVAYNHNFHSGYPFYWCFFFQFHSFISNLVISIIAAFFFSLVFEVPILIFEDMIFKRQHESTSRAQGKAMENQSGSTNKVWN